MSRGRPIRPAELVARLGGSAPERLGIRPSHGDDAALGRWLVAAVLLGSRSGDAEHAFRALGASGLNEPAALARADPGAVARVLESAIARRPAAPAAALVRAARALEADHGGSLSRLAGGAGGLDELGARLVRLAPGLGAATAARFLRALRDVWPLADEVPLSPAARAAAVHLGWLRAGEDEEGAPSALRAALVRDEAAPPIADVEAALERLGARACLRGRVARCPLGGDCPARGAEG